MRKQVLLLSLSLLSCLAMIFLCSIPSVNAEDQFEIKDEKVYYTYKDDDFNIQTIVVTEADSNNFKVIDANYARDINNVYRYGPYQKYYLLDGADPETFAVINETYSKDKDSVYQNTLIVEANGEAYYVNPDDLKMHYLGRPADAFNVMRNLGLGISNNDFNTL